MRTKLPHEIMKYKLKCSHYVWILNLGCTDKNLHQLSQTNYTNLNSVLSIKKEIFLSDRRQFSHKVYFSKRGGLAKR